MLSIYIKGIDVYKRQVHTLIHARQADALGHGVGDAVSIFKLQRRAGALSALGIAGRGSACPLALSRHIVHKVVHMHHIAAGENTVCLGLHIFVHQRAVRAPVHGDTSGAGQLVFRDQAHAEQNGVAVKFHFRARNRAAVFIHLRYDGLLHPPVALDIHDGVGQVQGDVVVVQALHDIARCV